MLDSATATATPQCQPSSSRRHGCARAAGISQPPLADTACAWQSTCAPGCQDTSVTPLPVYDSGDYDLPGYTARMAQICCLEYSLPYLPKSGFALLSLAKRGNVDLLDAILSYQVLNAATPVLIAVVGFGWAMYAVERRLNGEQFETPSAGVYFAMGACPRNAIAACLRVLTQAPCSLRCLQFRSARLALATWRPRPGRAES